MRAGGAAVAIANDIPPAGAIGRSLERLGYPPPGSADAGRKGAGFGKWDITQICELETRCRSAAGFGVAAGGDVGGGWRSLWRGGMPVGLLDRYGRGACLLGVAAAMAETESGGLVAAADNPGVAFRTCVRAFEEAGGPSWAAACACGSLKAACGNLGGEFAVPGRARASRRRRWREPWWVLIVIFSIACRGRSLPWGLILSEELYVGATRSNRCVC